MNDYEIKIVNKRDGTPGEYIGRPSVLGNPFAIGHDGTRQEVIAKYREWLWIKVKSMDQAVLEELDRLAEKLITDGGLTLVCWCAPQACHGDVLASAIHWRNKP
jgi:hypothetical protein